MKKKRILCFFLAFLLFTCPLQVGATEATTTESSEKQPLYQNNLGDGSVTSGCHSLNAVVPLWGTGKLLETAGAAMLYEIETETIMYAWNPDLQIHPAALVKIMTCLLALENGNLSDQLNVTSTAMATLPKGDYQLKVGEKWTLEQMLYCLMVGGYNDAAAVIAEYVAGSQQGFINMMNRRAKEIGCTDTVFTNATGLHDAAQLSTARDLVKILNEALRNEQFFTFFSETSFALPKTEYAESRYMETTNYMMTLTVTGEYYDNRVTGGRTGVTETRERCLVVTAKSKGLHYIAIVMCAKATANEEGDIVRFGSYEEVKELLNLGFDGFEAKEILSDTQILTQYPVLDGQNSVSVGPSESRYCVLPAGTLTTQLSYRYDHSNIALSAPVKAGESITNVQVWYENVCIAQAPVITKNSSAVNIIENQSVMIEENNQGLLIALRIIGILLTLVLVFIAVVYVLRWGHIISRRAQHRRRRKSRRRSK